MRDWIFEPNSRSRFDCVLVAIVAAAFSQSEWVLGFVALLIGAVIAALGRRS